MVEVNIHSLFFWRACGPLGEERGSEDTSRSGRRLRPLHPCFMSRSQVEVFCHDWIGSLANGRVNQKVEP